MVHRSESIGYFAKFHVFGMARNCGLDILAKKVVLANAGGGTAFFCCSVVVLEIKAHRSREDGKSAHPAKDPLLLLLFAVQTLKSNSRQLWSSSSKCCPRTVV
jgi:hypothetical protein